MKSNNFFVTTWFRCRKQFYLTKDGVKLVFYLVVGEGWSGILKGQAGDVSILLDELRADTSVRLIVLASLRHFFSERKRVLDQVPNAVVLPLFPGVKNWQMNRFIVAGLSIWHKPVAWICRGPTATVITSSAKNLVSSPYRVCMDGRGARAAEIAEYSPDDPLAREMVTIESEAIRCSDFKLAVSSQLVRFWKEEFHYSDGAHTIIPCSLSDNFVCSEFREGRGLRIQQDWLESDAVLVYSGGSADWQQSRLLETSLHYWLSHQTNIRILFLSRLAPWITAIMDVFPAQCAQMWVDHQQVPLLLSQCDYGLLMREESVTNRVSSPVKFAEYLSRGLCVLTSEGLGDYSDFVRKHDCGEVINEDNYENVSLVNRDFCDKKRIQLLAIHHFSKRSELIRRSYSEFLGGVLGEVQTS